MQFVQISNLHRIVVRDNLIKIRRKNWEELHISGFERNHDSRRSTEMTLATFGLHMISAIVLTTIPVSSEYRRVCYYTNWSQYRIGSARFVPENVDPALCTHLLYAFASLSGNRLVPFEWNDDGPSGMYARVNNLKQQNPALKTLLSLGGWNFGSAFSPMMSTVVSRNEFAITSISFLRSRNFDGLDLDFEYPGSNGSPPADKRRYSLLLQELRTAFDAEGAQTGRPPLLLTAAVSAGKNAIDSGYEVVNISRSLDFINLMSYDFHGSWESITGHNSPLNSRSGEQGNQAYLNIRWAAEYWVSLGAPRDKLVIGMATYGRCFSLISPSQASGLGAPASGPCRSGQYTQEAGFLAYYEICAKLTDTTSTRVWSTEQQVPYLVFGGNQWVGYDDAYSLTIKVNWTKAAGFGGWMVWNLDLDDFMGTMCNGQRYPLLRAMNAAAINGTGPVMPPTQPQQSTTQSSIPSTPSVTSYPPLSCRGIADGFYVNPFTCSKFYRCFSGAIYQFNCPDGLFWDASNGYCNHHCDASGVSVPSVVTTPRSPPISLVSSTTEAPTSALSCRGISDGFYVNPFTCSKFYRCFSGAIFQFNCPDGLFWDALNGYCNYNCDVPGVFAPRVETPPSNPSINGLPSTTATPTSGFSCAFKADGLYVNPANCTTFCRCLSGLLFITNCPAGLYYDDTLSVCNWSFALTTARQTQCNLV